MSISLMQIYSFHQNLFNYWRDHMRHDMKKQSKKDKMDESLSEKHGKESTKKQSFVDRRHESKGAHKKK